MLPDEYLRKRQLPQHLRPTTPSEAEFSYEIRPAQLGDLPSIRSIYNHYVRNSAVTFDEKVWSYPTLRAKFLRGQQSGMPWLVAVSPSGEVLGYASVSPWKEKAAYRFTVENSIYLGPAASGKGIGRALLSALIEASREAGIREIIAVIADRGAEASIALHEKLGFEEIGRMGRVGFKFDHWIGTVLMQLSLKKKSKR